jgi:5-methylcytosine-specific restriction endonuclease McrA
MTRKWEDNTVSGEWTAEELEIFALYGGRCILCKQRAVTLHEIIPKTKRPKTLNTPENRVPVCAKCHRKIHDTGAKHFVSILTDLQK